ncbi:MAG: sigma-54-dependent Fis family transcriptional regulator [Gammaproteobacteria bacterium]|nr:sigma-54-dependent Fis family transcriptional regulator [Gammaproteobacteria bacterium]
MTERVLIVEDDAGVRDLLRDELEAEGLDVLSSETLTHARELLNGHDVDLLVTDLRLPDGSGQELLEQVVAFADPPAALVITAFGGVRDAVAALKLGADDFLTKPLDADHFLLTVRRLLDHRRMRDELKRYRSLADGEAFHGMYGSSPAMRTMFEQIRLIAQGEGAVLILGESGTGKELVARALHEGSPRAGGPFVAVNCAGIPGELMESEFFGHATGAFTGARGSHAGLFRQAHGGTLLLDEIGEMPLGLQAKLLRVLEEGRIRPVGAGGEEVVDVRIVAATNRDVHAQVKSGDLREDLYFRLETFAIEVPPLRERGEDREILASRFLREFAARGERRVEGFTAAALALIQRYPFPGNVRELRNVIERAVLFCRGSEVRPEDLPARLRGSDGEGPGMPEGTGPFGDLPTLETLQQRYARYVLSHTGGNKKQAAAILGVTRSTLYRWLDRPSDGAVADS